MNKFFLFIVYCWRNSQPFGWIGVIGLYYGLLTWLLPLHWAVIVGLVLNPMALRVIYRLYAQRKELDAMIDQTVIVIKAKRKEREKKH